MIIIIQLTNCKPYWIILLLCKIQTRKYVWKPLSKLFRTISRQFGRDFLKIVMEEIYGRWICREIKGDVGLWMLDFKESVLRAFPSFLRDIKLFWSYLKFLKAFWEHFHAFEELFKLFQAFIEPLKLV